MARSESTNATHTDKNNSLIMYELTRKEAVNVISRLAGMLGHEAVEGNSAGAAAIFNVVKDGCITQQVAITVKD